MEDVSSVGKDGKIRSHFGVFLLIHGDLQNHFLTFLESRMKKIKRFWPVSFFREINILNYVYDKCISKSKRIYS